MAAAPPPAPPNPAISAAGRPGGILVAGFWMLLAGLGFATMIGLVRHASDIGVHPFEIAFFRNLFSLLAMAPWMIRIGVAGLRTARFPLYALRAVTGVASMLMWFWGVTLMPITEATALGFSSPFFVTILAALVLGEVVRLRRWTAVAIGFAGVLVILRPGSGSVEAVAAGVVVFSAALQAISMIMIKTLSRTESPNAIVAYMGVYMTPLALIPALFVWIWPSWEQLGWMAALGGVATFAHLCFARAIRAADASAIAPFDFFRLIFVALIGYFVFGQSSDIWTWIGAAIILAAGVYIARREAVAAREGRAKPPVPVRPAD